MLNVVKPVETVVENVEPVATVSKVPAAVKTDVVVPLVELDEPSVKAVQEVIEEVKAAPVSPNVLPHNRQNPLESIGQTIQMAVQNLGQQLSVITNLVRPQAQQAQHDPDVAVAIQQADPAAAASAQHQLDEFVSSPASAASASSTAPPNLFQNALNSITSFLPAATSARPQLANSVSSAAPAVGASSVLTTAAPPNLFQNALHSITSFLQRSTTTVAPVTEPAPAIVNGTKYDNVDIEHSVTVDNKIDGVIKKKI